MDGLWMVSILPDSRGSIDKILFHQTSVYEEGRQIKKGIFETFLRNLNKIGVKPEIYVFATYRNESEQGFLEKETLDWTPLVKSMNYVAVQVDDDIWSKLPYAQDVCLILNSSVPAALMTKSIRFRQMRMLIAKIESLLQSAGLRIAQAQREFNLEGGYVYASSNVSLYSNPADRSILDSFKQEPVFVESVISHLVEQILSVLHPGLLSYYIPEHVDLVFSIFEGKESCEVFYVDFRETLSGSPIFWHGNRLTLLNRRLRQWDEKMQKLIKRIGKHLRNASFHKVPGVIGYEKSLRAGTPFVYSGANLLFHEGQKKDYAFYLKFPNESEEDTNFQIDNNIETALKSANVTPIPVAGYEESMNYVEIRNSAGIRCLAKVLARKM